MMQLPASFFGRPIAHRALHDVTDGRPENSRAAIIAAVEAGYGIEIDLQLSADHVPMVFHDYDLARLAEATGPIQLQSASDLAAIPLRGGTEGIPSFAEVLDLVAGRVPLLVEIKDQDGGLGPDVGTLETATAELIKDYDGDIAVMSFNPHAVAAMRDVLPDVPRGLVTCDYNVDDWPVVKADVRERLADIPDFEAVEACFISHDRNDLNSAAVARIKAAGYPVFTWTIRSPAQEAEARKIVDNVTFEQYLA